MSTPQDTSSMAVVGPQGSASIAPGVQALPTVPIAAIVGQVNAIQEAMRQVMVKDVHYGVIPGTGNKPTLLKPGAEALSLLFRLHASFRIDMTELGREHREYSVTCSLCSSDGVLLGQGVGLCSTMESKYRYRKGGRICPECGAEAVIKGKEQYGGGWLCYRQKGGCGHKWPDGAPEIEGQDTSRVENTDPADQYNTVLKMAKKRAHVDAVLTVTAASAMFTQDIEDLQFNNTVQQRRQATPPPAESTRQPARNGPSRPQAPPQDDDGDPGPTPPPEPRRRAAASPAPQEPAPSPNTGTAVDPYAGMSKAELLEACEEAEARIDPSLRDMARDTAGIEVPKDARKDDLITYLHTLVGSDGQEALSF